MSIEERLERLERKVRWMRRLGAVGVALVAAVFLLGQGKDEPLRSINARTISAERLIIRPRKVRRHIDLPPDRSRIDLGFNTSNDESVMQIYDYRGNVRFKLFERAMKYYGARGRERLLLGTYSDNRSTPVLRLHDSRGKVRASFTLDRTEQASLFLGDLGEKIQTRLSPMQLTMYDSKDRLRVWLGLDSDSPKTLFYDADGKVIWQAPKE